MSVNEQQWGDFTRENYARLLKVAKETYRLSPVCEFVHQPGIALWRHDVDVSPQAAVALAAIECELGIRATYYFNIRSEFYNLFEPMVRGSTARIAAMGHEIGIHFDAACVDISSAESLERDLDSERTVFQKLLEVQPRSFSFHNPSAATKPYDAESYAGLLNAYSRDIMSFCAYCSDSNGYWRFTPLDRFLKAGHSSLCVLTHPEWWQERPMSPRERIVRSVEGRAAATLRRYDDLLQTNARQNIR